ncbi:MAG: hypothetical protein R3F17_11440 [Planctomycetota bacterium]
MPQTAVDSAIERGLQFLVSQQELDGSWRYDCGQHHGGTTGLCVYTLIKGGLENNHQAVLRGIGYLDTLEPRSTYEAACMLMAYGAVDPAGHAARIQQVVDQLIEWNHGAWAYPWAVDDLSNTHFGALGLRHGAHAGATVPEDTWMDIAKALERYQLYEGGFPYRPQGEATLSMTAAGVGIACMVREGLIDGGSRAVILRKLDGQVRRGIEWMASHDPLPDPGWVGKALHDRWRYYYLYALQRVGVLAPTTTIGEHDWYQVGARWLIAEQAKEGQWGSPYGESQSNSCFAILFLRRASAPVSGAPPRIKRQWRTENPDADFQLVVTGQDPLQLWIPEFHQLILDSYEWPDEAGKGLHVESVEYRSGDTVLAKVPGDATQPAGHERFATQVRLPEPGLYPITAHVTLKNPPGDDEPTTVLVSDPLQIPIEVGLAPWMRTYIDDAANNLLAGQKVDVECSSASDGWGADRAFDQMQGTGWLCREEDGSPWIAMELKKAIKADTILLSLAREGRERPGEFARAKMAEVVVNKRKPVVVQLDADEQHKTRLELPKPERIRRIEIRLLDPTPGKSRQKSMGLQEIELLLRDS